MQSGPPREDDDLTKVILLNGCSSAGKTTIAQALQHIAIEPFQHIALDQFRDGLPPGLRGLNSRPEEPGASGLNVVPAFKNGQKVTEIRFGEYGKKVLRAMRRSVAFLASDGCPVIVDDILFEKEFLLDYAKLLDPRQTWLVSVRCDLSVVRQREESRPGRFPGTAESHYSSIHEHVNSYDIEVDTSHISPRAAAEIILRGIEKEPSALLTLS